MKKLCAIAFAACCLTTGSLGEANTSSDMKIGMKGYIGPLKVLEMNIVQDWSGNEYRITSRTVSSGFAALFKHFDTRASTQGRREGNRLIPIRLTHQNMDGKKNRKTIVTWGKDDVVTEATPEYGGWGDPPATLAQKLEATDPMTALAKLTVSGLSPEAACNQTLHVFDGKQRYDLVMNPIGPDHLSKGESPALPGTAFKCRLIYKEVAGFKKKDNPKEDKFRAPITIWLSPIGSDRYVISRLRADVGFGTATIKITRLEIADATGRTENNR